MTGQPASSLTKSLGVFRGASLLLNIVIGAGLLTLPGLAIKMVGENAFAAWAICAVAAIPLLAVFIILGCRYPDAGGIAAYARRAFGSFGARVSALLLLGAVVFGLPSIALTGGHYLASQLGGNAHVYALVILMAAVLPNLLPGEGASKAMAWIASSVLAVIVLFLIAGWAGLKPGHAMGHVPVVSAAYVGFVLSPFMMLFFAFTGWEVGAGVAEEFRNPSRDYPLAMVSSFVMAAALYLAIAYVAQNSDLSGLYEAPFVAIVKPFLGNGGAAAVAAAAALLVFANLSGAVWGVSRLIFSLGRDGGLPRVLAAASGGRPVAAVICTVVALIVVLIADGVVGLGLETMIALAGQNFLILYAVAAAALTLLARSWFERALGILVILIVVGLLVIQGQMTIYPIGLLVAAAAVELMNNGMHGRRPVSPR
ncbi:APC family permease [Aestuariivirga sp.]|jgi:amino acid efflux transporter|uniref:APC family permease n=1 Tax=Aestuariivirga sp. TaxID=2650926 RepID=UPI00378464E4